MTDASDFDALDFLNGGGEMGAEIRARDWTTTRLGPPATWPLALRMVIRLMLTTNHPMFVFWGPDLLCFYNDAYSHSIGPERHPVALGQPGRDVWDEIWDIIGPQIDVVMSGKGATWNVDHLVPITRHGRREDVYWTYSYSPIDDPTARNGVGGVLVICTETTERIQAEQALARELSAKEMLLAEVNHRIKNSLQLVSSLLRIESARAESDETRRSLARAAGRVRAIGAVHELIYRTDNIETVQFDELIQGLCQAVRHSALSGSSRIEIRCDAPATRLPTDLAITLALVVNELLTNALKHAYRDDASGVISVSYETTKGALRLVVGDDGAGKARDAEKGLGMQLIEGLVGQIDGTVTEPDTPSGYVVAIEAPLPSAEVR